jgi:hypothetical protein
MSLESLKSYRKGEHAARLLHVCIKLFISYVAYIHHRNHVQNSTTLANLML